MHDASIAMVGEAMMSAQCSVMSSEGVVLGGMVEREAGKGMVILDGSNSPSTLGFDPVYVKDRMRKSATM